MDHNQRVVCSCVCVCFFWWVHNQISGNVVEVISTPTSWKLLVWRSKTERWMSLSIDLRCAYSIILQKSCSLSLKGFRKVKLITTDPIISIIDPYRWYLKRYPSQHKSTTWWKKDSLIPFNKLDPMTYDFCEFSHLQTSNLRTPESILAGWKKLPWK